jgi:hypothetical protein
MPDHTKNDSTNHGMQSHELLCSEFDGLLSDALDGVLTGSRLHGFQAHARNCSTCGPLFAEVEAGRNWLKDLTEVEPPAGLVTSILASTTGVDTQRLRVNVSSPQSRAAGGASLWERAQAWASGTMRPIWATVRQPRFAMSFGMAFFSLSLGLSILGVKPADLSQISLRPAAIRHTYYNTQARVVRYYENIRFVYEVESRVRELKRNVAPAESAPAKKDHKNDTTQQPEQKQDRDYSQNENHLILASAPVGPSGNDAFINDPFIHDRSISDSSINDASTNDPSVVPVTTYRRFV